MRSQPITLRELPRTRRCTPSPAACRCLRSAMISRS